MILSFVKQMSKSTWTKCINLTTYMVNFVTAESHQIDMHEKKKLMLQHKYKLKTSFFFFWQEYEGSS